MAENQAMCSACFEDEITAFPFSENFLEFDAEFKTKLANEDIRFQKMGVENFPNSIYECTHCKTIWWLSLPDHEWRGFFVHNHTAREILKSIRHENKRQSGNCLGFFALLWIILILIIAFNLGDIRDLFRTPQ